MIVRARSRRALKLRLFRPASLQQLLAYDHTSPTSIKKIKESQFPDSLFVESNCRAVRRGAESGNAMSGLFI
jgi:hypothetical protein